MMNQLSDDHLRITNLQTRFTDTGETGRLGIAITGLTLEVTLAGLRYFLANVVPDRRIGLRIDNAGASDGATFEIEATQWSVTARVRVDMRPERGAPGLVSIALAAGNRWSPLDQAMLGIVRSKLTELAHSRPGIDRTDTNRFTLDVGLLVQDRIAKSGAPVHWDVSLTGIESTPSLIRLNFAQKLD